MEEIDTWIKQSRDEPAVSQKPQKKMIRQDIDGIIKKAIDSVRGKGYNASNGKPGQSQSLGKEGN